MNPQLDVGPGRPRPVKRSKAPLPPDMNPQLDVGPGALARSSGAKLRSYIPGIFNPPSIDPIDDCSSSSTFRTAAFPAAVTRSCNISISPDFTISGSIVTVSTCFWPFIFTVTDPPPADP